MIKRLLILGIALVLGATAFSQTLLTGTVTSEEDGLLYGANVQMKRNGVLITGAQTDFDGNYRISNIDAGTYDLEFSYVGHQMQKVSGVVIFAGKEHKVSQVLTSNMLKVVEVFEYRVPLIKLDQTTSGGTLTGDQIAKMPNKSVNALAASTAGASSVDGGDVTIKGSRPDGTDYYLDGIRISGNMIPQSEIDQLEVITGGIEAKYGDVTGGIISITTRGPADKFSGGLELETSQYLDAFGYNLGSANLSGPIWRKGGSKDSVVILGYRISAQYLSQLDDDPPATDIFRVTDDALALLEANPMTKFGQSTVSSATFLTNKDVKRMKYNPFENREALDITAKLEARLSDAVDVALFGSTNDVSNRFTPNSGNPSTPWTTYNSHNNPTRDQSRYRGNFRLRHRLGNRQGFVADTTRSNATTIENASYTLQAGYEVFTEDNQDPRHKDRLFDYGYIGQFDYVTTPIFEFDNGTQEFEHVDFRQDFVSYTAGAKNPVLARYNNISDLGNENDLVLRNGSSSNVDDTHPWDLHTNVGTVYNRFSKQNDQTLTGTANFTFDLIPNGNKDRAHSLQFGLWYEQRINRFYSIAPYRLWEIGNGAANVQIETGLDTVSIYPIYENGFVQPNGDTSDVYNTIVTSDPEKIGDRQFYKRVRELTGQTLNEYVNINSLSPDQLRLDMFSARELNDPNLVNYYGYDYLGNELGTDVTFEDFFTARDPETDSRTFPVAPFQPVYQAGFIQDRFRIGKDLIMRVGVRVDRYDANQKVLKDPYTFYDAYEAGDFYELIGQELPSNIGSDFKVYTTDRSSNNIKAFRKGDQWYTNAGVPVDSRLIFGQGGLVFPKYIREGTEDTRITELDFDPNEVFEDYTPQVNVMPRLAFSFPISDVANFFAHYDILVQRPPSNNNVSALDFYYWNTTGRFGTDNIRDNANLLPERTIDYEVGYQQKLNDFSALKVAAFYKEMRDMVQLRTLINLPGAVTSYTTYDNIDFGTVKGLTFQYDLRPQNNLSATLNYTLQFAEATGSDSESQRGLTNNGSNIRNLFPLNFDERHRVVVSFDYRFADGKAYSGPKWFGTDIFARAGANLQIFAVSGRPYTAKFQPSRFGGDGTIGSINGARLPWTFQMDGRIDKDFKLGKGTMLNVYLRSQNILNIRNVVSTYEATGSPTDDGYINSPRGQQDVNNFNSANLSVLSFLDSYQWRLLNPDNYSLPRRVFLGAIINF